MGVPRRAPPAPSPVSDTQPWYAGRGSEFWLNRIGIGLLLFSVAFLFQYSVDQGWLTPPIRVAFGLALGVGLACIGLRVHGHRRWFGQAMLGAASATLYITGFAAFQLFQLVSYPVALAFLVLVTVLTFWAAVRQDEAALALLGALGGLGTPFLLYTEAGTLTGLVTYTCVVLAGTSGIYLLKGWRTLLWTTVVGGWSVLLIGYDAAINYRADDLDGALAEACPDGIDVYFDNTSGPISDAVYPRLNIGARCVVCGTASVASWDPWPTGPRLERHIAPPA